jgi:hypothetical protein
MRPRCTKGKAFESIFRAQIFDGRAIEKSELTGQLFAVISCT